MKSIQRLAAMVAVAGLSISSFAQWSSSPSSNLRVADLANGQTLPKIQPTSDGGCYVSWFDNRTGGNDVYLQRLNAQGVEQWPHNGILICDRGFSSTVDWDLIVDSAGNAVVVYNDDLAVAGVNNISASRVDPAGTILWKTVVSTGTLGTANPHVMQLSSGSLVVGYSYFSSPQSWIAQSLDATTGAPQWTAPGINVIEAGHFETLCDVKPSGTGFVALWIRGSGTNQQTSAKGIYLQKFDAAGVAQWNAGGPVIAFAGNASASVQNGYFPTMTVDGAGGVVFAWYEVSGARNAYVQHVLSDGSLKFASPVSNASTAGTRIRLGAALAYDAAASEYYIASPEGTLSTVADRAFVQKISTAGALLWGNTGVEIIPINANQPSFIQCLLQPDGCIVAGLDTRSATTQVVFAAKAKNDQTVPWSILINDDSSTTKGRLVSTVSTQGFAMFAYQWGDTSMGDIGVQNVNPGGTLGPPPLPTCYADCDHVGGLTGNDFQCFLDAFVANSSYADCDGVGGLTGNDFQCFLDKYVAGCS